MPVVEKPTHWEEDNCLTSCSSDEETLPYLARERLLGKHAPIRMIMTDMDGTFLNSKHKASAKNVAAFASLKSRGIVGVIATGRPRHSVINGMGRESFEAMLPGGVGPGIFMNGSVVYGLNGELLVEEHIRRADLEQVLGLLEEAGWRNRVCGYNEQGIFCEERNTFNFRLHDEYGEPEPVVVPPGQLSSMNFSKLIINGTDDTVDDLRPLIEPRLAEGVKCVRPLTWNLEVIPAHVSKATGMNVLLQHCGLHRSSVVAVGDSENDVDMLKMAGLSVVVRNGTDVAKRAAMYATVSNDEDAFAHVVKEICSLKC